MKTNAVIENILGRRSVRAYADKPVAHEDLETIVACGQWAPSGVNKQEWCFVVVDDRAKIARLCEAMRQAMGRDSYDMYNPAAIVIVGHVRGAHLGKQDDGCAMENMMLAAHSLGLGSVWINQLLDTCDDPSVRAILTEFGLPQEHEVHGACALGYAAEGGAGKAHARKSAVVWA